MFGSIKPLKGKDRFQTAPDWLKDYYSLLRSIGTDIEPEGGLFRLTASQQAINKFYGRPMAVKELPMSCEHLQLNLQFHCDAKDCKNTISSFHNW